MASCGRRSLPSRLILDSPPPLRPRPKPPDLNFHRHKVHTLLLLHSPLVLTTIPLPINAIPCDSSTDQKNKPLTSSSKLVPRALFHRSRRRGHTRLYRLPSSAKRTESKLPAFPDSSRSFIPQPRTLLSIKVDVANNWTKMVEKLVENVKEKNGKEAHLVHWQYGECSTNLYQNNSYQNSGFQRSGYQNSGYHQGGYGGYDNNNGNGNYSYNHQPLVTYVPSYPPRGDPYASDEESSSWSIM
ncbi:hypothetical protein Tco_0786477 [Tanacetum coccineum]